MRALLLVLVIGCSSHGSAPVDAEDPDHCDGSTYFQMPEVDCADGNGVCVTDSSTQTVQCYPKCGVSDPGIACPPSSGTVWFSIEVSQSNDPTNPDHVCYCAPIGHGGA
jgi:hypothetical protein